MPEPVVPPPRSVFHGQDATELVVQSAATTPRPKRRSSHAGADVIRPGRRVRSTSPSPVAEQGWTPRNCVPLRARPPVPCPGRRSPTTSPAADRWDGVRRGLRQRPIHEDDDVRPAPGCALPCWGARSSRSCTTAGGGVRRRPVHRFRSAVAVEQHRHGALRFRTLVIVALVVGVHGPQDRRRLAS